MAPSNKASKRNNKPQAKCKESQKQKRRVSFPEQDEDLFQVVCYIPNREDWSPEEHQEVYFTKDDFHAIRQNGRMVSLECERYGNGNQLDDTYSEKNPEVQARLNVWALNGHEQRGLERWANRSQGDKREREQFSVIMAVLQAQEEMTLCTNDVDIEKLRKVSYKASKVARHFARMMGKADFYAVNSMDSSHDSKSVHTAATSMESSISTVQTNLEDSHRSIMPEDELRDSQHHRSNTTSASPGGRVKKLIKSRLASFKQRQNRRHQAHKQEDMIEIRSVI